MSLHTTPRLRQELVELGILPEGTDASFRALGQPRYDEVWTKAACHVIRMRQPHLLLVHLLNTDGIHHRYGPETAASYTALALADCYVGQILDALEMAGIRKNTSLFVVADHGFSSVRHLLEPHVLFARAGLLQARGTANRIAKAPAMVVAEGGTGMIYLTDPATREADRKTVTQLLLGQEGVADVIGPDRYPALGLPVPEQNPQMPDLMLLARDGYAVSDRAQGDNLVVPVTGDAEVGAHAYLASNPNMNALFVASGRGLKHGLKIGLLDNIDVAPTIAHLLGHELPGVDGKPISEILSTP